MLDSQDSLPWAYIHRSDVAASRLMRPGRPVMVTVSAKNRYYSIKVDAFEIPGEGDPIFVTWQGPWTQFTGYSSAPLLVSYSRDRWPYLFAPAGTYLVSSEGAFKLTPAEMKPLRSKVRAATPLIRDGVTFGEHWR